MGFAEGKQFVLDIRDTRGDLIAVEEAARDLEQQKVNLIYTVATSVSLAAKRATKNIPIVFAAGRTRLLNTNLFDGPQFREL
jgi:ABC-type uncharacterized transport system substrate-binding protein